MLCTTRYYFASCHNYTQRHAFSAHYHFAYYYHVKGQFLYRHDIACRFGQQYQCSLHREQWHAFSHFIPHYLRRKIIAAAMPRFIWLPFHAPAFEYRQRNSCWEATRFAPAIRPRYTVLIFMDTKHVNLAEGWAHAAPGHDATGPWSRALFRVYLPSYAARIWRRRVDTILMLSAFFTGIYFLTLDGAPGFICHDTWYEEMTDSE